jgi:hypothetical protein
LDLNAANELLCLKDRVAQLTIERDRAVELLKSSRDRVEDLLVTKEAIIDKLAGYIRSDTALRAALIRIVMKRERTSSPHGTPCPVELPCRYCQARTALGVKIGELTDG